MSHILEVQSDGTKKATVIGSTGIYTVYQTEADGVITVTAGALGGEPFVRHKLGSHQSAEADQLFEKLHEILGTGKTVIKLADYAKTDPEAEAAETPADEDPPADEETEPEAGE